MGDPISVTHPAIAAQLADPSLADVLTHGSGRKVAWRCSEGHEWEATTASRVRGTGCPYCAGHRAWPGFNDLATTHPEVAAMCADFAEASRVTAFSSRKLEWVCPTCGTCYRAAVSRVTMHAAACPECAQRRAHRGRTDFATTHPDLASELVDVSLAAELTSGSHRRVAWRCAHGHVWDAPVNRRAQGHGCPYCAGKRAVAGVNDLATTRPDLASELVDASLASELTESSMRKVLWHCAEGHEWEATVANRSARGSGCPYCGGSAVLRGFNDLATTHPELASELVDPAVALEVTRGSHRRAEWRCGACGHVWTAAVHDRTRGDGHATGCPKCAVGRPSRGEAALAEAVRGLLGDACEVLEDDSTVVPPYELDVVVPARHMAFEFNGTYWHSEAAGRDRRSHVRKQEMCREAGYSLVYVWEDDWRDRRDAVVGMLASKLGCASGKVHARSLSFGEMGRFDAVAFLERNHIQGPSISSRYFALRDASGEALAVIALRSPRASSRMRRASGTWEVQRYATSCHVVGGFSKLLANAERTLLSEGADLVEWVSFSANEVSDGNMYAKCGFALDGELPPDYRYAGNLTGGRRVPKERFQRKRFREDDALEWDESWTEARAAEANGLYRCWDCGKRRWVRPVRRREA